MKTKTKAKEIAIMDINSSHIDIHDVPKKVKTEEDLEDYIYTDLAVRNEQDWISSTKRITISDYRKNISKK